MKRKIISPVFLTGCLLSGLALVFSGNAARAVSYACDQYAETIGTGKLPGTLTTITLSAAQCQQCMLQASAEGGLCNPHCLNTASIAACEASKKNTLHEISLRIDSLEKRRDLTS